MTRLAVAVVLAVSATAHADGVYVAESFGVALSHGALAPVMGNPMHVRVGAGVRFGALAVEAWVLSDLQTDREGAWHGILGGTPRPGTADLEVWGGDLKLIVPIDPVLSAYVRIGPSSATGTGALAGYSGYGLGAGGGFQITGRVRALGFLWAPLFFLTRGPKVTGALYLDQGYDFYTLRMTGADAIHAHVGHVSVGFAVGSAF